MEVTTNPVNELFAVLYEINPLINFGNKTQRKAAEQIISKLGIEKTLATARYAVSVYGKPYAPVITTPTELRDKLSKLVAYHLQEVGKRPKIISV